MSFITQLQDTPEIFISFVSVIGLMVGSFLNVVIYRIPKMLEQEWTSQCCELLETERPKEPKVTLSTPNSTCPKCEHEIKPWENIPVISYLFLRGKCSSCKTHISLRYPIIELITGILSLGVVCVLGANGAGFSALLLTWVLIALTMIDFDAQLLPDNMTLPLVWLGLIVNSYELFVPLENALWGAVAGYLSLWTVYHGFKLLTGKEGMGFGDFKLLAALGAWMGWQLLPVIILLSSLVGAVVGILLILIKGRDKNIPIPFGPYLAAAGWLETVYVIASSIDYAKDKNAVDRLADQKLALDNLLDYLSDYKEDNDVAEVLGWFNELELVFANSSETKTNEPSITFKKKDDGKMILGGGSSISISEKQFNEIKEKVNEIRTKIVAANI